MAVPGQAGRVLCFAHAGGELSETSRTTYCRNTLDGVAVPNVTDAGRGRVRARNGAQAQPRSPRHRFQVGDLVAYRDLTGTIISAADATTSLRLASHPTTLTRGLLVRWRDGTTSHFLEPEQSLILLRAGDSQDSDT